MSLLSFLLHQTLLPKNQQFSLQISAIASKKSSEQNTKKDHFIVLIRGYVFKHNKVLLIFSYYHFLRLWQKSAKQKSLVFWNIKVQIFYEGHKILRNLHRRFDRYYIGQIYGGDFAKLCGLLRIYELYKFPYTLTSLYSWIWLKP